MLCGAVSFHFVLCRFNEEVRNSSSHGRQSRWWKKLKELDSKTEISENIRADLLLELSGLSATEQLMIRTSCQNKSDFQLIADALVIQHPRIQHQKREKTKAFGPKSFKPWRKVAHIADEG